MFSNEGLGGGGQRAQKGGKMAGTGGWAMSRHYRQETGMGHNILTGHDMGRWGGKPIHTHNNGTSATSSTYQPVAEQDFFMRIRIQIIASK